MTQPAQTTTPKGESNQQPAPRFPGWLSSPAFLSLLLAAIAFVVFWPVAHYDYTNFDDPDYVTSNTHVLNGLTAKGVVWAFSTGHAGNWHPLTWISHMLDVSLFGKGPSGPHLVNLLLHAANTALLFILLQQLTGSRWRSALVAALFSLHPLHVESVAWIAERKDVLSTCFGLLSLWMYAQYVEKIKFPNLESQPEGTAASRAASGLPSLRDRTSRPYFLSLLFFALGLMSKPMLVTLPFVLLLLDYWPLCRFRFATQSPHDPVNAPSRSVRQLIVEKIPFFALTFVSSIVTFLVQHNAGAMQTLVNYPTSARIGNALISYARYLGKVAWPISLATPYSHPGRWPILEIILAALLILVVTVAVLRIGRKFPFALIGWLWFVGTLVPVIGIIQVGGQPMADRYMYLPSIGLFIIFAWGAAAAIQYWRVPPAIWGAMAGVLLIACSARTRDQLRYWQNSETLFVHDIAATKDNWTAYYNLGWYLDSQGRIDEALANYAQALRIRPNFSEALNNVGYSLVARKQYAEAIKYFQAALKAEPQFLEGHINIGNALRESGKIDEAIEQYRLVLKSQPDHVGALKDLGNILARKGQYAEAIPYLEHSLRLKPDQPLTQYDLANALARLKRNEEAIVHYRLAVQQNPQYAEAHHDLGIALARAGKLDEAVIELQAAIRSKPEDAPFHRSLAKVFVAQRKLDAAVQQYNEALRLKPDFQQAKQELQALRVEQKR
jgi:tetratricopeptide (TPR) repeat protein